MTRRGFIQIGATGAALCALPLSAATASRSPRSFFHAPSPVAPAVTYDFRRVNGFLRTSRWQAAGFAVEIDPAGCVHLDAAEGYVSFSRPDFETGRAQSELARTVGDAVTEEIVRELALGWT